MSGVSQDRVVGNGRRFLVHACLGRGGFGEVYRATMVSLGGVRTEVAVKILRADIDPGSEAVKRLCDEGRLLGALRHPAILRVHDLVLLEDRVALVTEYVEGQDLDDCFHGDPPLPLRGLVAAVGEVAAALDAAWSTLSPTTGQPIHLVHRDVKPANIRIGRHGEVKLLDFGIARATDVAREAQTANDAMMGSYLYMPPERFHEDTVDPPSDIYALGCVMFEGLARTRLFEGMTLKQIYGTMLSPVKFHAYLEERFALIPEGTPPEVGALLRAMLDMTAELRPTALDVARRCEELVDDLSGATLKRWARQRAWPRPDMMPGTLDGRALAAQSFVSLRSEVEEPNVPSPWTSDSGPLPPLDFLALPSPGLTALDAPPRRGPAAPPPPPEPEPEAPEPEPTPTPLPQPSPSALDPEPPVEEEDPHLPELGSLHAFEHTDPAAGLLDEAPSPANDDFDRQLRELQERKRLRSMMVGFGVLALVALVVLSGAAFVAMGPGPVGVSAASGGAPKGLEPEAAPPATPAQAEGAAEPVAEEPAPKAEPAAPRPQPKSAPKPAPRPDPAPSGASLAKQGWAAVDRGRHAEALRLFDQALNAGPGNAEANYGRGYVLMELGRTDEAITALCRAVRSADPGTRNEIKNIMSGKGLACP